MYSSCHPPEVLFCPKIDGSKKRKTLYFAALDELLILQLFYELSLGILPAYFINSKFSHRGVSPNLHLS